jgi:hypothetical protein
MLDETHYTELGGGILEGTALLLNGDTDLYVYPKWDTARDALMTADQLKVAPNLAHLYAHLIENRRVFSLPVFDQADLPMMPAEILQRIQNGDMSWERYVPPPVAERIRVDHLFGFKS